MSLKDFVFLNVCHVTFYKAYYKYFITYWNHKQYFVYLVVLSTKKEKHLVIKFFCIHLAELVMFSRKLWLIQRTRDFLPKFSISLNEKNCVLSSVMIFVAQEFETSLAKPFQLRLFQVAGAEIAGACGRYWLALADCLYLFL